MAQDFTKDPNALLDYTVDWATWLDTDTISASSWTVPSGLTQASPAPSNDSTTATIWLSGGAAGSWYAVTNRITTAAGRINDASIFIHVQEL